MVRSYDGNCSLKDSGEVGKIYGLETKPSEVQPPHADYALPLHEIRAQALSLLTADNKESSHSQEK